MGTERGGGGGLVGEGVSPRACSLVYSASSGAAGNNYVHVDVSELYLTPY